MKSADETSADRYIITGPHPDNKLWTIIDRHTREEVDGFNAYCLASDLCQRLNENPVTEEMKSAVRRSFTT